MNSVINRDISSHINLVQKNLTLISMKKLYFFHVRKYTIISLPISVIIFLMKTWRDPCNKRIMKEKSIKDS